MPDVFGNLLPEERGAGAAPAAVVAAPSDYPGTPSPSPPILSTSWKKTGATEHGDAEPWQEQGTAIDRIARAATDAYRNAPTQGEEPGQISIIPSAKQDVVNQNLGGFGRYVVNPVAKFLGQGIADVGAVGAGIGQAGQEALRAVGLPQQLRRDITIAPQAIGPMPELSAALTALQNRPRVTTAPAQPSPNYIGDLKPTDVAPPRPVTLPGLLDSSDTGIPGPIGSPSGYTAPAAAPIHPATVAEMHPVATFLLDKAKNSGADLQPDYTNKFIAKATAAAQPAGPGTAAIAGPADPVNAMVQRIQGLKDQPLSIKDVMGMDQELNARKRAVISSDPDLARRIGEFQDTLRAQVDAATQGDVGGGAEGWQAFSDGRAAYTQFKKMQKLEDIRDAALGMEQPATNMQNRITKWANDPRQSRNLDDPEKDALKNAGERGYMGEVVRSAGGRLAAQTAGPVVGAIAGAMTPFPVVGPIVGGFAGRAAESLISTAVRKAGVNAQLARVSDALKTLGSKVDVPSDMPWPPQGGP